jgi:hypothetical protein
MGRTYLLAQVYAMVNHDDHAFGNMLEPFDERLLLAQYPNLILAEIILSLHGGAIIIRKIQ